MNKFSIFTCTYKTTKSQFHRLYESLKRQNYTNWDWWILDDSPKNHKEIGLIFQEVEKDDRVKIIRNVSHHGSIGFNKHIISMCCDGDYLVEVDHDDELISDCLSCLNAAFEKHPECKFAYSDTLEMVADHTSISYGDNFSFGQGYYKTELVDGWWYKIAVTSPSINAKSIRGIYAAPNHVRCWERNFYHQIGGHNMEYSVCDDYELLIRTFLNTKMVHVNKVLYVQHEEDTITRGVDGSNTQSIRFDEIQRLNWELYYEYDKQIHDRIIELGYEDQIWEEENGHSNLDKDLDHTQLIDLGEQMDYFEIYNVDYHITDKCNLNCVSCNHFCPLVPKETLHKSLTTIFEDLKLLSKFAVNIDELTLLGGEPFLHPGIKEILGMARELFPYNKITITTNGVLYDTIVENIPYLAKYDIGVKISEYPFRADADEYYKKLRHKLDNNGVLRESVPMSNFLRGAFSNNIQNDDENILACRMRQGCSQLSDGKLYICNFAAQFKYLDNAYGETITFAQGQDDYVDLKNCSIEDIRQLKTKAVPELCKNCIECTRHYNSEGEMIPWDRSKKERSEWIID